jgi:cell wall-associated NlpC family hydrolase
MTFMGERQAADVANGADGEQMGTNRRYGGIQRVRPWWRPLACSTVAAATIAALFSPVPAFAAPDVPAVPVVPAVPDAGSRPIPLGTLTMPGQATAPVATTPATATGVATTPLVAKIEKRRADIAVEGDKLIKLGEERDLARQQAATADQRVAAAQSALTVAQQVAATVAADAMRDAAALPPGTIGSGLQDLDALAAMQRGESPGEEAAARQLTIAQAAQQAALADQSAASARAADLSGQYDRLNAEIAKKQTELQELEQQNSAALAAAEAAEAAEDAQLGAQYLGGANVGRGADIRAIAALQFALAQRGDPYVWSEEGPNEYDCSGLMYAAYHSAGAGNFPLTRVSRDQYWQTRDKVVDRYSLLPGDLLFFSSTTSWTGIHHVAMYAGDGMMVEAPRTGLNVRLVPVRWTRLFQATRVYGSVEGDTEGPALGSPDPETPATTPTSNPTRTTKPSSRPTTSPSSKPPTTKPSSTTSTTKPSTAPSSTAPSSPSVSPTTLAPTTTSPTTTAPISDGSTSTSTTSTSTTSPAGSSPTGSTSQAEATESAATANSSSATSSPSASG